MSISDKKMGAIIAHRKGYVVIDNQVYFNGKVRKLDIRHKKDNGQSVYASFGIRNDEGKRVQIFVHHLVAYKKFGKVFIDGVYKHHDELVVLHLDGDTLNNRYENIILGTRVQAESIKMGHPIKMHESNNAQHNPEYI